MSSEETQDHKREKESFQKWHKTFSNARMQVPVPNFPHNFYHSSSISKSCTCVTLLRNIVSLPNADRSKSRMLSQEVIKLRRKPELFCHTSTLHWMPTQTITKFHCLKALTALNQDSYFRKQSFSVWQ